MKVRPLHLTLSIFHAGVKVRVYCQVGKADQGKFALNVAVKTLELYKKYVRPIPVTI